MRFLGYIVIGCTVGLMGCSSPVRSIGDYLKWLNEPGHGLVKTKTVNGVQIKIKYLPPEYLAWKEISNEPEYTHAQKDSILGLYKNSISFLFSIGPDSTATSNDIMFKDISTYHEYSVRTHDMNFFFGEKIRLTAGPKEYRPVLTSMENIYGIGPGRNIMLVFVPDEKGDTNMSDSGELALTYVDDLYSLGVNHFVFKRSDINNAPKIEFGSI